MSKETNYDALFCVKHPEKETTLRCAACGNPMCVQCAQYTHGVGYKCRACIKRIQEKQPNRPPDLGKIPLHKPVFTRILMVSIIGFWFLTVAAAAVLRDYNKALVILGAQYGPLILQGQVWRLFTSMFLHADGVHLGFNVVGLLAFGTQIETLYGRYRFLFIYILSGLFGSLASFVVRGPTEFSVGASGGIFGIVGAYLIFFHFYREELGNLGDEKVRSTLILIAFNFIFGFVIINVNNLAHLGGLIAGLILGYGLVPRYEQELGRIPPRLIITNPLEKCKEVFTMSLLCFVILTWLTMSSWSQANARELAGELTDSWQECPYETGTGGRVCSPTDQAIVCHQQWAGISAPMGSIHTLRTDDSTPDGNLPIQMAVSLKQGKVMVSIPEVNGEMTRMEVIPGSPAIFTGNVPKYNNTIVVYLQTIGELALDTCFALKYERP